MAEIVGIVASFLGPVIELGKCCVAPIQRQLNYLCCFSSNIHSLKYEAEKLDDVRRGLQMQVDTAKNNAENIIPQVETWLKNVDDMKDNMSRIENEVSDVQSGFLTIKARFSLSKRTKKAAEHMKDLQEQCKFTIISQPAPPAAMEPAPLGKVYEFESRKQIEEDVMTTLRGKNDNMIGICGMGGVGKTTMAKKIMNRVREENLFDEVVMAVISQQVDELRIQLEVAESLGLKLEEKTLPARAHKLRSRLTGTKRTLIVLDDVWESLKLEDLGIPCDSDFKGCTVLLTSRNRDVLSAMNVQKVHGLKILSEGEARFLFREKAGTCVDDPILHSIAEEVIEECQGLPIALIIVARVLKDENNISIWKDALQQLQRSNPGDLQDVTAQVYNSLKLSYDYLLNDRAKSLFLLCCLFREDESISLEYLTYFALGLLIFEEIKDLEEARNRTYTVIKMLKNRFLLLDGPDEHHVRMHDIVRDVAIFIAKEERYINGIDCTWMSSFLRGRAELPVQSGFSKLRLLFTNNEADEGFQINDSFIGGTRELNVMFILWSSLRSLPHKTELLKNLRTLILVGCLSLESISLLGKLVNLEILICRYCHSLKEFPLEIGKLHRLKLLEISDCRSLETIAPGTISNLVGLEELTIKRSFSKWEGEENKKGKERKNARLSELESLSNLTFLAIEVEDYTLAAQNMNLSSKIVKYDIAIGLLSYGDSSMKGCEKQMKLHLERENSLGNWIRECARSIEYLHLESDGSNNLDLGQAHLSMRALAYKSCSTVKKLVNIRTSSSIFPLLEYLNLESLRNLEEICDVDDPLSSNSFTNLKELELRKLPALKHLWKSGPYQNNAVSICSSLSSIKIGNCDSLHNLFSFSKAAKDCLPRLEKLEIWDCKMMEEVFLWKEEENDEKKDIPTVFPKLRMLKLWDLPNLTTLCKGIESIKFPILTNILIANCRNLKRLEDLFPTPQKVAKDFLPLLEKLEIKGCTMMEEVFLWKEEENDEKNDILTVFPKLKTLDLRYLPNLTTLCKGIESIEFPLLTNITITSCRNLKRLEDLFPTPQKAAKDFLLRLEYIEIRDCEMMEEIFLWKEEENDEKKDIPTVFPKLRTLVLGNLPSLTTLCKGIESIEFPLLTGIRITSCQNLKRLENLFPTTQKVAKDFLLRLEWLEIRNCKMMEELFLWKEEENDEKKDIPTIFPKLKTLDLQYLPNLTTLCKGIESIEFPLLTDITITSCRNLKRLEDLFPTAQKAAKDFLPLLERLEIRDCEMMEEIFLWKEEENDEKKDIPTVFPKLRTLVLGNLPSLTTLCKGIESIEFPLLTDITITSCKNLKRLEDLFPTPQKPEKDFLPLLERLKIKGCTMMEEVFLWKEEENDEKKDIPIAFPKLRTLVLGDLPSLTTLCKGIESIEFPLLTDIRITSCQNLKRLKDLLPTPQKAAKDFLLRLKWLEIRDCKMMEEVFLWKEEENDEKKDIPTAFPKLRTLVLGDLPSLTTLCKGIESIEFPLLTDIRITSCKNLKCFEDLFPTPQKAAKDFLPLLERLEIRDCKMMEEVFLWKEEENDEKNDIPTVFPKLKTLDLRYLPNLTTLYKGIESIEFPLLTDITIIGCKNLKRLEDLFPTPQKAAKDFLPLLEKLEIEGCTMMEEVFLWKEEENDEKNDIPTVFPKLNTLDLRYLPNLTTLCKGIKSIEFPLLTDITITGCRNLKRLEDLFPTPQKAAKDFLPRLEQLEISDCTMMEEVFLWNEEENDKKDDIPTVFPKLRKLVIENLPNLTTLCKGIKSIEFPLLTNIRITSCRNLKRISYLFPTLEMAAKDCYLSLESLFIWNCEMMEEVFLWNEEENDGRKDINGLETRWGPHIITIRFPKLKMLTLRKLPNLTTFCRGIERVEFSLLIEMTIIDCPQLKSLVSTITTSGTCGNNENNSGGINHEYFFPTAKKVACAGLEELTIRNINTKLWCPQISLNFFRGLNKLFISRDCSRCLFLFPVAREFVNLKWLKIWSCIEMVKMIEDKEENEEEEDKHVLLFPQLVELELQRLPKLEIFWERRCALELPSLQQVKVRNCCKLKKFSMESLTTPNLTSILIDKKERINNTKDLNGAVQQEHSLRVEEEERKKREEEERREKGEEQESGDEIEKEQIEFFFSQIEMENLFI